MGVLGDRAAVPQVFGMWRAGQGSDTETKGDRSGEPASASASFRCRLIVPSCITVLQQLVRPPSGLSQ